jgi:hypothetical protein
MPRGVDRIANTARDPASAADFDKEDRTCLM